MPATVWKGHLSFGLVSIPVRLYRAARAERVKLRQLYREEPETAPDEEAPEPEPAPPRGRGPAPVSEPAPQIQPARPEPLVMPARQALVPETGDAPIPRGDIVKGYEYDKDRYVLLDRAELASLKPKTSSVMQILEFVRFSEIDPIYLETSYYMAPDRSGEKAYAMLFEAMRRSGYSAVAEVAMHGREHVVIVRPGAHGVIAHTMYYENEIRREAEPRADVSLVGQKELELATLFVQSLAAKFEPQKYTDKYRERLEALIAERRHEARTAEEPKPAAGGKAEVIDLMDALQRSLAMRGKPPQPAEPKPKRSRPRAKGA